jgi:TonB family protein
MIDLLLASWLASLAPPETASGTGTPPRLRSGSISDSDYPSAAIRAGEQGRVRIILNVAPYGGVTNCRVEHSSGSAALDFTACQLATQRFKFDPGRDAQGRPVASTYAQSVRWVLPGGDVPDTDVTERLPVFAPGEVRIAMAHDSMGMRCAVETRGPAFDLVVARPCPPHARVPIAELMQENGTLLSVTTLIPEDSPAVERRPVRGILVTMIASEFVVAPDGTIASCNDVASSGQINETTPSFCQQAAQGVPMFQPDPAGQTRRGRVEMALYRSGAREA